MICTIPVGVQSTDNYIELIGSTVPATRRVAGDEIKYFLAEKTEASDDYFIIGFSDKKAGNCTSLTDCKRVFASKYLSAKRELVAYRREQSKGETGCWGTSGLHHDIEYFSFLAEQCHYLLEHDMEEHSLSFWRNKSRFMNYTKMEFMGEGGYYKEYLPIQQVTVDGVEVVFDPNDVAAKAAESGVIYNTVDEMLSFATAGDLAYGGVVDE